MGAILKIQLLSVVLMLIFQLMGMYSAVCYSGGIISGFTLANMYSLCVATPNSHGFQVTVTNSAHIVLANCIGEGVLVTLYGYSMKILSF